jgi:hypothetical protein
MKKLGLNTILTSQFQTYLFLTFIIPKFLKFCNWFTINPIEGSIVSKWNLSKIWIYFLAFSWKCFLFFNLIFSATFSIYFTIHPRRGHGVQFRSPITPSSSFGEYFSYSNPNSPPSFITAPFFVGRGWHVWTHQKAPSIFKGS